MKRDKKTRWSMVASIIIGILIILTVAGIVFMNKPSFGRLPRGERLERIKRSPHYRNGAFQNQTPTLLMTSGKSRIQGIWDFLLAKKEDVTPSQPVPAVKTDLKTLPKDTNLMVWFGHSSYFLQLDGKRILVDPVFCQAAPVSFVNKPFKGTDLYQPEDMPDIDYLVITHDHWDHLDYETVKRLKSRIRKVICPLGVGEHFESWGFSPEILIELDWQENAPLDEGFLIHCLPARHFSGRGLKANQTLWASFLLETPTQKVYLGGDGGYDTHFAEIGRQHPGITLAIMENGQYNEDWRYIHLMPAYLSRAVRDLKANQFVTVHHSKYALARHPWDEPLKNEQRAAKESKVRLIVPEIGEVVPLDSNVSSSP